VDLQAHLIIMQLLLLAAGHLLLPPSSCMKVPTTGEVTRVAVQARPGGEATRGQTVCTCASVGAGFNWHATSSVCRTCVARWSGYLAGKQGTDWEGGWYPLTLRFPADYPAVPPQVTRPPALC
jgi:hypothetical protein